MQRDDMRTPLEHFRAKWKPVRVKKPRQTKEIEPPFRFHRNGKGSSARHRPWFCKERSPSLVDATHLRDCTRSAHAVVHCCHDRARRRRLHDLQRLDAQSHHRYSDGTVAHRAILPYRAWFCGWLSRTTFTTAPNLRPRLRCDSPVSRLASRAFSQRCA
jgi:hypothetical protein